MTFLMRLSTAIAVDIGIKLNYETEFHSRLSTAIAVDIGIHF